MIHAALISIAAGSAIIMTLRHAVEPGGGRRALAHAKALIPVMARPTISACIVSVPS